MPSPLGHALGSLIVGARPGRTSDARRLTAIRLTILAAIGVAPDLDLLWGRHSMETHSVGAALIAGLVTLALARTLDVRSWLGVRTNLAAAVLVATVWVAHPLMDMLGADNSPPFGVMLWWPFSHMFVIAPFHLFDAVSRMYWRDDFLSHNLAAAAREALILGPVAAVVWFLRRRQSTD